MDEERGQEPRGGNRRAPRAWTHGLRAEAAGVSLLRSGKCLTVVALLTTCLTWPPPAIGVVGSPPPTMSFLRAAQGFAQAVFADVPKARGDAANYATEVAHQCHGILRGAPDNEQFKQLASEAELAVLDAFSEAFFHARVAFASRVAHLRWGNASITELVHARAAQDRAEATVAPPRLCADLEAWRASDYRIVPEATRGFLKAYFIAHEGSEASNEAILKRLAPGEGPAMKKLAHSIEHLEAKSTPMLRKAIKAPLFSMGRALGLGSAAL